MKPHHAMPWFLPVAMLFAAAAAASGQETRAPLAGPGQWEFSRDGDAEGWTLVGLEQRAVQDGVLRLTATVGNPMLYSPVTAIAAASQPVVSFRLRLGKGLASNGCVLFVTETQPGWSDATLVTFACQADGEFHTYDVDMSRNALWRGTVTQLRLQPFYVGGWPLPDAQRGVELDYVRVPRITAAGEAAAGAVERVPNGGFEELAEDGKPVGWTTFYEAPLAVDSGSLKASGNPANSLVSDEAHTGRHALTVVIPGATPEIGGWQTRIAIPPNRLFRLSFWAKRRGTEYALVSINEFKADGSRTAHYERVVTADGWERYRRDFMSQAETTGVQIACIVWNQSACQAWFDEVSLTEVGLTDATGLAAAEIDASPFNLLTTEVVTPHLAWAKPWAGGPLRLLATPACRDVVELAQRLSLEFQTWRRYEEADAAAGNAVLNDLYYGARERGLVRSYRELATKLAADTDVLLFGQTGGGGFSWESLPEPLRQAVLDKVRQGAGLIYVRPSAAGRAALVAAAERELPLPGDLAAGVPYAGLTVLDRDAAGTAWLQLFALGKGRLALVDYQNEQFGFFEGEKSFRRGVSCPFTPDLTYDPRGTELDYEYYLSFLAKLALWVADRQGPLSLAGLEVRDGTLLATIANRGQPVVAEREIVVRDRDGNQEARLPGKATLGAGATSLQDALGALKAGGHFVDLWLRADGKVLTWGSAYFETRADIQISALELERPFSAPGEPVRGKVVLDHAAVAGMTVRLQLVDSLGRLLAVEQLPIGGRQDLAFELSLDTAVAIVHRLTASLCGEAGVIAERSVTVLRRRESRLDDFTFSFWTGYGSNGRYLLDDIHAKGFEVAYTPYLYAQSPAQVLPLFRQLAEANVDLALFAFSLAAWDAGSDPTATVSPRCLTRAAYRQNLFSVLAQHASVARQFPVYGYSLGDEAGIAGQQQDYCFSPTCLDYQRAWLRASYGTLAALNESWGTRFADWDTVMPMTLSQAKQHGNYAPWVDHRLAMEAMFADLVRESGKALRVQDPTARVGAEGITGGEMYGSNGESSTVGYDFGRLFPLGQFWGVYFQHYPQIEYLRSFAPAEAARFTYTQPFEDYPDGYYRDVWTNEKINRFVPWYGLFNGMNGNMYWDSMATTWYGFYAPDYRPTPWSVQIAETVQEIKRGVGKLLLSCRRDNSGIAIHYSPASFHVQTIMGGRERVESPKAFCRLLEDCGLQYDFISAQQLAAGKLSGYKALILPRSYAIGVDEATAMRAFVAGGGTLIADGEPGSMDGHGRRVTTPMLAGVKLYSCAQPVWPYAQPAGRAGEVGQACRAELSAVLRAAGVEPPVRLATAAGQPLPGCEIVQFSAGEAAYLGILQGREYIRSAKENHDPVPVTITLPRPAYVYSVRDGADLGLITTIQTGIEPAVAKVYALLPSRVTAVAISGLREAYAPGATVSYDLQSQTVPPAEFPHVFRVEVRRPDGSAQREYSRTIQVPAGRGAGSFGLALNDPPGGWTIRVTDVATGIGAEARFTVP